MINQINNGNIYCCFVVQNQYDINYINIFNCYQHKYIYITSIILINTKIQFTTVHRSKYITEMR